MHVAAALTLASVGACIACLVYLHLAPTGYSPVRNAVSEYGVGPYARWYAAQAAFTGFAAVCLAVALGHPTRVVVGLGVLAAARFAIGSFPTDTLAAGQRTARGGVHLLLAVIAFATTSWVAIALPRADHGQPSLGRVIALFAVGTMVALRTRLRPWFGLVERGYYVAMLVWFTLVAARLL